MPKLKSSQAEKIIVTTIAIIILVSLVVQVFIQVISL